MWCSVLKPTCYRQCQYCFPACLLAFWRSSQVHGLGHACVFGAAIDINNVQVHKMQLFLAMHMHGVCEELLVQVLHVERLSETLLNISFLDNTLQRGYVHG